MMRRIVYTDLDGTLLDHDTYDVTPALPAIDRLRGLQIPIVLCSSKTAAEMAPLRRRLSITAPFIAENGGGIYFPDEPRWRRQQIEPRGEFRVLTLGTPIRELAEFVHGFSKSRGVAVRTFLDYSAEELSEGVGLKLEEARRALRREFDLPFEPLAEEQLRSLEAAAAERGLRVTRGGRFHHLTGPCDKGEAVRELTRRYQSLWGERPVTIGLGDSRNDLEMLRAVDQAVIIPNPHFSACLGEQISGALTAPEPGPRGWRRAVDKLLNG